jgi:tetratricopeptide (TPR) repeat protein
LSSQNFRQCKSTATQNYSPLSVRHSLFATRYSLPFRLGRNFALPFLVATPLLKTCQNFCQRKEVKAMRRELSDIIAMVEAGQLDLILQAAQEIEEAWLRSWVLRDIAKAMAEAGQFDPALQVAQRIEYASDRSEAFTEVAIAMAKAGQTEEANQAFQFALQAAQKLEDAWGRSWTLREIAEATAKAGQLTLPSKPPRKLKSQSFVLWRSVTSPKRWRKQDNLTTPFKPPRKLKTQRIVLRRLVALPKRW